MSQPTPVAGGAPVELAAASAEIAALLRGAFEEWNATRIDSLAPRYAEAETGHSRSGNWTAAKGADSSSS